MHPATYTNKCVSDGFVKTRRRRATREEMVQVATLVMTPLTFDLRTEPSEPFEPLLSWLHLQRTEKTSQSHTPSQHPSQNSEHLHGNQRLPTLQHSPSLLDQTLPSPPIRK